MKSADNIVKMYACRSATKSFSKNMAVAKATEIGATKGPMPSPSMKIKPMRK